jgi:hypothetical protein
MSVNEAQAAVTEFMTEIARVPAPRRLSEHTATAQHESTVSKYLQEVSGVASQQYHKLMTIYRMTRDDRALRAALVMSECVAELFAALAAYDDVETLDAVCDGLYVLLGTGVQFAMPVGEGFAEVHRSNMTKRPVVPGAPDGSRVSDKGPAYTPPDLLRVWHEYQNARFC